MRLLGVCGTKQSGKSSSCNYIMGLEMQKLNIIERFDINSEGKLLVNHDPFIDDNGNEVAAGMGPFDFERRDQQFTAYCAAVIWPHARMYSFAESLKWVAVNMFRVAPEKVYGTDADKETFTQYSWDDLRDIIPGKYFPKNLKTTSKKMTGRQFLQILGDVFRWVNDSCFIDVVMKQIAENMTPLSLIPDCRRIDEIKRVRAAGGKLIYLTKGNKDNSGHRVEKEFYGLDMTEHVDVVIDNENMTIEEKNAKIHSTLTEWGWLN